MRVAGFSHGVSTISIHIQRVFWQLLSKLLKSVAVFGRAILVAARFVSTPFRIFGQLVFALILVNLYQLYRLIKKRLCSTWRPAKNRVLFPLTTRFVMHGMLIVVTLLVTTNSLKAREIRQDDTNGPRILSSILRGGEDSEITETADGIITSKRFYDGIGGVSPLDVASAAVEENMAATQDNSTLLGTQLASTTVGERAREGVVKHVVEGGETVSDIADRYNISVNTVLWENRLGERDFIKPGQVLTVLPTTGVSHQVQRGDTVASIAQKYKADEGEIISFNKLASADAIDQNEILLIPNGTVPPPPPVPQPTVRLARASVIYGDNAPPSRTVSGSGLLWPTPSHKINQYYRGSRHTGVDIDGDYSSPIYAADSGRVVESGWHGGYGIALMIDHGNGTKTLYGHASKLFVKAGDYVTKGQTVAMVGTTGYSTGTHLHFEVIIGGSKPNPLSYIK